MSHYTECKSISSSTTACILVPEFLVSTLQPLLKGMSLIKTYPKDSALFDAATASGMRCMQPGTHWPTHIHSDAIKPATFSSTDHICHAAAHQPVAQAPPPAQQSDSPLTMLFEGLLERQAARVLLDSGATANFLSKTMLESTGLPLWKSDAVVSLADGNDNPIFGETKVSVHIGALHLRVNCFVTDLAPDFDFTMGNGFLLSRQAVLNYFNSTCTVVQDKKVITLNPLSSSSPSSRLQQRSVPTAASARAPVDKLLLNVTQCKRAVHKGCDSFLVLVNAATAPACTDASGTASVAFSASQSCCGAFASHQTAQPHSASVSAIAPPSVLAQQTDAVKTEFADVFAEPSGVPPDRGIEHGIPLEPDAQPPFKRTYRLSPAELVEVKRQVTELLQKQLIEPSVSPYGAPILFVT